MLLLSLLTLNPVRRAIAPQIIISRWYTSTSSSISSSGSGSGSGKVPSDYDLEIPPDSVSGSVASECGSVEKSPGPHSTKGTMSPGTIDAEVAGDENGQKSLLSCSNSSQSLYSLASSVVTPPRTSMTPEEVLGRFTVVRGQVSHANSSLSNLFDRSWSEASKRGHVDRQHSDKKPNYQQPTQSWEVNERYRDCRYLLSRGSSERGVTGTPAAFEQNISSGNLVEKGVGGLEGQSPWRSGRGERVGPSVDGRRVSCDWSLSVSSCMEDSISHLLVEQRASPLQVPAVPVAVTAMEVKPLLARRASMSQFNSSSAEKDAVCSPLIDELDKTLMSKERDSPVVQKVKFPLPTAGTSPGVSPVAWPAMFDASGGGGGNQESLLDQVDMTILSSPTRTAYSNNTSAQIENALISSDEVVTRTSFGFRPKAKTMSPLPTERKSTIAIDSSRDTLSRVNKSGSTRFHVSSSSTRTTQRLLLRQNSSDF